MLYYIMRIFSFCGHVGSLIGKTLLVFLDNHSVSEVSSYTCTSFVKNDAAVTLRTNGAVINAAEPRVVLTDDVPRLCREVTSYRCLVSVTPHPRSSRYDRVSAADRCSPQYTHTRLIKTLLVYFAASNHAI